MAIKHGANVGLGYPAIGPSYDNDMGLATGTITQGVNDATDTSTEYVWTDTAGTFTWEVKV